MKEELKKNCLGLLSLFMVLLGLAGCKEQMDEVDYPSTTDELVTVSLNFGFADNNDELYRNGSPQRLAATARRNGSPQRLAATARRNGSPQRLAATARRNGSR